VQQVVEKEEEQRVSLFTKRHRENSTFHPSGWTVDIKEEKSQKFIVNEMIYI
jgi:hypothetical protein